MKTQSLQRNAIESLNENCLTILPSVIDLSGIFLENHKKLYVAGISVSEGNLSKIKGLNVLVLTESKVSPQKIPLNETIKACKFAVLLRKPSQKEINESPGEKQVSRLTVELLEIKCISGNKTIFKKTKKTNCYVNIL